MNVLQVKVYSGIIMPEIQRMTRCGIVFQSFAIWCSPPELHFKCWAMLTHICIIQAHRESGEGAAEIASQGFVKLKLKQVKSSLI